MTGLESSAAPDRAIRHGVLDGNVPDLVRLTGVSNPPHFFRGKAMPLNLLESATRGAAADGSWRVRAHAALFLSPAAAQIIISL